uniref:Uncharacterized protein n=1 Tax=Rhizophora mucronata TaxID=61149 RepID=A0A2P2MYN2_RHIMU
MRCFKRFKAGFLVGHVNRLTRFFFPCTLEKTEKITERSWSFTTSNILITDGLGTICVCLVQQYKCFLILRRVHVNI